MFHFYYFNFCYFSARGALTSKPYSFVARSWEFKSINTVDFFDSLGSSIRVDIRGDKIIRILPRVNELTNDEWISDKIRFCADGLRVQRVDVPLVLSPLTKSLKSLNWFKLISIIFKLFTSNSYLGQNIFSSFNYTPVRFFEGVFGTLNSALSLQFLTSILVPKFIANSGLKLQSNLSLRQFFTSPFSLKDCLKFDFIVLCGFNTRYESPIFNIRLRYGVTKRNLSLFNFGSNFSSSFPIYFLGGVPSFINFLNNKHWLCSNFVKKKAFVIFNIFFSKFIHFSPLEREFASRNVSYSVLSRYSSTIQNYEVGNLYLYRDLNSNLFGHNVFLGLPSLLEHKINNFIYKNNFNKGLNLVFAHHGDNRLNRLDVTIPTSAVYEQDSSLINCEGLNQTTRSVLSPPKNVLDLSEISNLILNLSVRHCGNISFSKLNLFVVLLVSFGLQKELIWNFVNKFFFLVSGRGADIEKKIPVSIFLKDFLLFSVNYLESTVVLDHFDLKLKNNFTPKNLIVNKASNSPLFKPIENFYVQDEISSSSLSLTSASERLTSRQTYSSST